MSSGLSKLATGENNRAQGRPGYPLGLHTLTISLPICYYYYFFLYLVGWMGDKRRRKIGGQSGVWWEHWGSQTWTVFLLSLFLRSKQQRVDSVTRGWEMKLRAVDQVGLAQETSVLWPLCCHHPSQKGHSMCPCLSDPLGSASTWERPVCHLMTH